ncbi:MAG: hypothetical protein R3357_00735 [Burkholderiales bacterium]|nr:hypothetical protein [Burkholderiales bacterium]
MRGTARQWLIALAAFSISIPGHADAQDKSAPSAEAIVPPAWIAESRVRFQVLLAGGAKQGTLVLPFQALDPGAKKGALPNGGGAIDLHGRMAMAHLIASRLAQSGERVADPALVALALGETRAFSAADVANLVRITGARRVIVGFAGWWREPGAARKLDVVVTVLPAEFDAAKYAVAPETASPAFRRQDIPISDAQPPEIAFSRVVDAVFAAVDIAIPQKQSASAKPNLDVPKDIESALQTDTDPETALWRLQLLAVLHPQSPADRGRERVSERSVALIARVSEASPDYRVLKARSLKMLDRRPAAIAALEGSLKSAEERALHADLRGDLPRMVNAVGQIGRPLPRLIAELELYALKWRYGWLDRDTSQPEIARIVTLAPEAWHPVIRWQLLSQDGWNQLPAAEFKAALDRGFPLPEFTLDMVVRGKLVLGEDPVAPPSMENATLDHVFRTLAKHRETLCCSHDPARPGRIDWLMLHQDWAVKEAERRAVFLSSIQGRHRDALNLLDGYDKVLLREHPTLMVDRIDVNGRLMQTGLHPQEGKRRYSESEALGRRVHAHVQYQDWNSTIAFLAQFGPPGYNQPPSPFDEDFPMRWYWADRTVRLGIPRQTPEMARGNFVLDWTLERKRTACAYTLFYITPCDELRTMLMAWGHMKGYLQEAKAVEREMEERFIGDDDRMLILGRLRREADDGAGELAVYREAIKLQPQQSTAYRELAKRLIAGGQFSEASKTALSYPPLKANGARNTVGFSNYLGEISNALMLAGAIDEARPLLELNAGYENGSNWSLWSKGRLALLDGRFNDALLVNLDALRRYSTLSSMRRYSSLLFAMGYSEEAWAAIKQMRQRSEDFQIWRAMLVGFRMQGMDRAAAQKWAAADRAERGVRYYPGVYPQDMKAVFQLVVSDRGAESIAEVPALYDAVSAQSTVDPSTGQPPQRPRREPETPIMRLSKGMAAFKRADYKTVFDTFDRVVHDMRVQSAWLNQYRVGYSFVPYYVLAAGKVGAADRAMKGMEPLKSPNVPEFRRLSEHDFELARGVAAAMRGDHRAGEKYLNAARGTMPAPGANFLSPDYVFVEICETLAKETGQRRYLELALDWSKRMQRYEPWTAWAYAFEAKHAKPGPDRTRALAMALYLDPLSERISGIDKASKDQAEQWLAKNNPFKKAVPAPGLPDRKA